MEPRKKPILLEMEVVHPCYCVDTTAKVKGSSMKWLTTSGRDVHGIYNVYRISSPRLKLFLEKLKGHPLVREVQVIRKVGDIAEVSIKSAYSPMVIAGTDASKTIFMEGFTKEGEDTVTLLAPSEEAMRELFGYLEKDFDIKLKAKRYIRPGDRLSFDTFRSSGFLQLASIADRLTPKQLEIFELACRRGYYEEPKKATIEELAEMSGISAPTFSEHLRKAEAKLLPVLAEILKPLK